MIFCLLGKSGSGKDTVFKRLKEDEQLKLKPVVSYTTRPKRTNETDGIEYHFIDKDQLNAFVEKGKVIELREYDTIHGKWCYATIDDGQIQVQKENYIVISTLEAYINIKNYYGADNVVPVYIKVEDGERLIRAILREKDQLEPKYEELCRRFLADNIDFGDNKLNAAGIEKEYCNIDLNKCVEQIKKDILKII